MTGNVVCTLPDFPSEIRAPAGSLGGVSGFQLSFADYEVHTPGDLALRAGGHESGGAEGQSSATCSPAASSSSTRMNSPPANLAKAAYAANPLADGALAAYRVIPVAMTRLNEEAVKRHGAVRARTPRGARTSSPWGWRLWLYDRPLQPVLEWLMKKFRDQAGGDGRQRRQLAGRLRLCRHGRIVLRVHFTVAPAQLPKGRYRRVTGNEAAALGLVAAAHRAGRTLVYASYPITPASEILHELSKYKEYDVRTLQTEDEIAACVAAIGASFGGAIGATGTSGPGLSLKAEGLGLAVMTELPLVVVNVQRAGPSTGMPTKTEQTDLLMAMYGRHGECPLAVLAAATPADCFRMAFEAVRLATKYMTPVLLLSDSFLANGAEPWRVVEPGRPARSALGDDSLRQAELRPLPPRSADAGPALGGAGNAGPGAPHRRPGKGRRHRGGQLRRGQPPADGFAAAREDRADRPAIFPRRRSSGPAEGELLVVGWGSTYGAIAAAVEEVRHAGARVAHLHLRYLNPFPRQSGLAAGQLPAGPGAGEQHGATLLAAARPVPRATPSGCARWKAGRSASARFAEQIEQLLGEQTAMTHPIFRKTARDADGRGAAPPLTRKDFQSSQEVKWCPGCGDYGILAAGAERPAAAGHPARKLVFVSGIGCSSRFPYYMNTYGMHSIHGRAPAIAMGLKCAAAGAVGVGRHRRRRRLSIGTNHMIHCMRRNLDVNILLFNNQIYGLTKGSTRRLRSSARRPSPARWAPSSSRSIRSRSPWPPRRPLSPARSSSTRRTWAQVIEAAARHKGTSFVEILQNCVVFNDGVFGDFTDRRLRDENWVLLEHGKPIRFGADGRKGIVLRGMAAGPWPSSARTACARRTCWCTTPVRRPARWPICWPRWGRPISPRRYGIFRQVERPTYDGC